jgi:hypothetical protein
VTADRKRCTRVDYKRRPDDKRIVVASIVWNTPLGSASQEDVDPVAP